MNARTKATSIPPKVREQVEERDGHVCVFCHSPNARGEAHYIRRSQGGLGIPENLLTLCRMHHRYLDEGPNKEYYQEKAREYLKSKYPNWDESKLVYNKWDGFKYQ